MGFRFRKSVNFGPFRVNFSKSGIGYSVGGKGFRATKKAGGGFRTTASIPGTGISYTKDYPSSGSAGGSTPSPDPQPDTAPPNLEKPPRGDTPSWLRWTMSILGWTLILLSIFLSCVEIISGLISVALGIFLVYRFSPFPCEKPIFKRKWFLASSICWALFAILGLATPDAEITSLNLDCSDSIQMDVSETKYIPVLVEETGADTDKIKYSSSDESIVTFEASTYGGQLMGLISPVGEGEADVTISSGGVTSNTVHITVIDSARIAAEEAARKAAEEEAARKAAEEEAARKAAEEAAKEEAARQAEEEAAAKKAAEEKAAEEKAAQEAASKKEQQSSNSQGGSVWIPQKGKKYHSNPSCSNMHNPSKVTRAEAEAMGYTPCKKCY